MELKCCLTAAQDALHRQNTFEHAPFYNNHRRIRLLFGLNYGKKRPKSTKTNTYLLAKIKHSIEIVYWYINKETILATQQTQDIGSTLFWCWPTVFNGGPTSKQLSLSVSFFTGPWYLSEYWLLWCGTVSARAPPRELSCSYGVCSTCQ